VEDRRWSTVGTVGERELGDEDLRAEGDSRRIEYFDRYVDTARFTTTANQTLIESGGRALGG
jgi:hypothetical protein